MSTSPDSSPKRVSLRDIAKEVGVTHVTVSLALRNHPRISAEMRMKVQETAERLGYRPDPMLAALANYRRGKSDHPITSAIAWINAWPEPDKLRSFREFDLYWKGAHAAAEKFGYRLEEFRIGGTNLSPQRLHEILSTRDIRGLLLPPHRHEPNWEDFPWSEYSVVRFGRSLRFPRAHLVTSDQVGNTLRAFATMSERGYERIGFVTTGGDLRRNGHLFEAGFLAAQREVDESRRVPILHLGEFAAGPASARLAAWIKDHGVDAIYTDLPGVSSYLKKAGISCPGEIGLAATTVLDTGIDSGINQNPEETGRVGFLTLNALINDGTRGIPSLMRQILVEGTWIDGISLPLKPAKPPARKKAR
ncbi:LacI family DNA-binding transcriptional regulator [Luteolibacter luteus]|uniref:LacI family transcriptional regulator n=1 Tax=Luteolibacter luteus TaxID=2728835 RepID=A0A858RKV5_9BACT|nr:LacI family DNA-binding transcriptional regulator [Luteolibacter luteus]QJE97088.1 LacI family transcriptional regulator [Luteolibacter luteus]